MDRALQCARSMPLDRVLVFAAALLVGQLLAVAPLPATAAALAIAWMLWRALGARGLSAAVGALALGAGTARAALERFEARRVAARDTLGAPARCAAEVTIAGSPIVGGG